MSRSEYTKRAAELLLEYAKNYDPRKEQTEAAKAVGYQITFLAMIYPTLEADNPEPPTFEF